MFQLEAIHAGKGDALLLRWGPTDAPQTILIDGGERGPYKDHLRARLEALAGGPKRTLALPLVVVSHVDDDHIAGILRLLGDVKKADDAAKPRPVEIGELWHNGFHDLQVVSDLPEELRAVIGGVAKPSSVALTPGGEGSTAVVESYAQGRTLIQQADALGIARNDAFDEGFVRDEGVLELDGLRVQVLCPDDELLIALGREWARALKALKKKHPDLEPASLSVAALGGALDDPSVPNQSSIVLLVTYRKKTMLLTGDVRGDHLLAALKRRKLISKGAPLEVDLFKVGHHASAHSNSKKVFAAIKAKHYVVSGNGHHGNPHPEIVKLLVAECLGRDATLYLTNEPDPAVTPEEFRDEAERSKALLDAGRAKGLKVVTRTPGEPGVTVTV